MRYITEHELAERDLSIEEIINRDWESPEAEALAWTRFNEKAQSNFEALAESARQSAEAFSRLRILRMPPV